MRVKGPSFLRSCCRTRTKEKDRVQTQRLHVFRRPEELGNVSAACCERAPRERASMSSRSSTNATGWTGSTRVGGRLARAGFAGAARRWPGARGNPVAIPHHEITPAGAGRQNAVIAHRVGPRRRHERCQSGQLTPGGPEPDPTSLLGVDNNRARKFYPRRVLLAWASPEVRP